jgi:CheY-like chemotaxis protein
MLEKLGHEVVTVPNGRSAVEQAFSQSFDLILMDVQMPELDGLSATREIRRLERAEGRHRPIVAMTANAMKGDRENCIEAGMDDYIAKPIRMQALSEAISNAVRQAKPGTPLSA